MFLTLEATEIVLFIGIFAANTNIVKIGGYVGVLTALFAWYTSAAGVATACAAAHPRCRWAAALAEADPPDASIPVIPEAAGSGSLVFPRGQGPG